MNMASSAAIQVEGVAHRYGSTVALNDVSIEFATAQITGIIGPDGVGKSTLLGLIAGVRKIQTGRITTLGGDIGSRRHRRAVCPRIAYMPQGLGKNLYMDLTILENLNFFGRLFGQSRNERKARIGALLKSTGLEAFANRPAGKLSGGMKQKLGLCCALIHDPDLLVLDEPTTGVDPLSRRQFWELIDQTCRHRPAMTVLIATAYMEEAERFDSLVAMDGGAVLATGSPAEIKAQMAAESLEEAFIALSTRGRTGDYQDFEMPPRNAQDGDPAILAQGLTRRFGDFTAVDDVSFRIERGEIFGFLGSNGCGKTTTMKMLTGLLSPSSGEAWLFGEPTKSHDPELRKRVGYMSQSFSLYAELTVRQNLDLHARLFHLDRDRIPGRIEELFDQCGLSDHADHLAADLPLGVRQRLSLAVAIIHEPEVLILDEPTSGVDPIARDRFWKLLIDLSRNNRVTIFISTHFMNEAARCDRISLMHRGRVLASDTPAALKDARNSDSLEDAFVAYLIDSEGAAASESATMVTTGDTTVSETSNQSERVAYAGARRLFAYSYREAIELWRDPVRLAFAFLGTALLMMVFGYGITFDVERLTYATLDQDQTPESRTYLEGLTGSRYFLERPRLNSSMEMDQRMKSGDITSAIVIPPGFGKDLLRGRMPEVAVWIDGAMPFRAETVRGYVDGLHQSYLMELSLRATGTAPPSLPVRIEPRYRYNQDFKSVYALVPINIALLLIFIPAILTALGVVREKELGPITNFYVTPVTRLEFLFGKQLPYIVIGLINFLLLVAMAILLFNVPVKGSFAALSLGALLYISATTGIGLLVSCFTRTQIAALFGTAIGTMVPAIMFSGMMQPITSLEGGAAFFSTVFPSSYFMTVSVGTFTKALTASDLVTELVVLACFTPILTLASTYFLNKQER